MTEHLHFDELSVALSVASLLPSTNRSVKTVPTKKPRSSKKPVRSLPSVSAASTAERARAASPPSKVLGSLQELMGSKTFPGAKSRGKYYITTAISCKE